MSQQSKFGGDALFVVLTATIQDSRERVRAFETELSELKSLQASSSAELKKLSGNVATPKGTIFGNIGKMLGVSGGIRRIQEVQQTVTDAMARIEMVRSCIEIQKHIQDKTIDDYLLASDEQYRRDSMRWNAVMRLKHALEFYAKEVGIALKVVQNINLTESIRKTEGKSLRTEKELLSCPDVEKALVDCKERLDVVVGSAEDVVSHDKKVTFKITITYHGGAMKFDLYTHPTNLCLYQIESIEDAIGQLDGLGKAIRVAQIHVEEVGRHTIADRLRYQNRIQKALHSS